MDTQYLSPKQVEERYGITRSHLGVLRHEGKGPKWFKPTPRKVLYAVDDVTEWIEASAHDGINPKES
ncbi:helix-turn-helix transcriptional regulator [Agromyces subbeticus]|uniref:helix-turn-helix transcriptional regulator n=1 Tax=Agromyces subbeticus TaxID=293890 RepID=UPI0003B566D0|nr:helix-turn-helix domain-containing protein [Agromyces subbeticus]